jgi:hypothetical protein
MNSRKEAAAVRRKAKRGKGTHAKTKLGLPDLEHAKSAVLVSLRSPESQRSYRRFRLLVLFRAAVVFQQNCGHAVPNSS